jgi:hypothetical protein
MVRGTPVKMHLVRINQMKESMTGKGNLNLAIPDRKGVQNPRKRKKRVLHLGLTTIKLLTV